MNGADVKRIIREDMERTGPVGKKAPKRDGESRASKASGRMAKALAAHERIEAELSRVMNRWQKSRATLRRLGKQIDAGYYDDEDPDPARDHIYESDFNDEV